jgi:hypothetical protein
MRAVLLILILAVVALLIAIATGFLDISQTRPAKAPDLSVNGASVTARGGQAPTFDVETGSVAVGTKPANVAVPTVKVIPPDNQANQVSENTDSAAQ